MIKKLRTKFIIILMCVVALILLAVFAAMLLSTWDNSRRMSENMLRQALYSPPDARLPPNGAGGKPGGAFAQRTRTPILVAEIDANGNMQLLTNQLHFMDADEATAAILAAIETGKNGGVLSGYDLRWLSDGTRIALTDISIEREMLQGLILNALLIGGASLAAFFFISLLLSRWAVRPVSLAWERQKQFVADASHELKTPLTVILSNADMLSRGEACTEEKKLRRIEHIQAEATRMKNLVEDLLSLAKSDGANNASIQERVDLSFIVTSAALAFEPVVFGERKTLSCDVRENIFTTGDAQHLRQLSGILLDNAVKYCPQGGHITVRLQETERKAALLMVANDGAPIPRDELPHVFERFYRVDKSRSAHGGFGLGLAIARNIVAEHGGKIWAESAKETGNRFYVMLPL